MNEWLQKLQQEALELSWRGFYRWPRTPIGNLQAEIWRRVGASDLNLAHPDCRTATILRIVGELSSNKLLSKTFTMLDLCCGDGLILSQVAAVHETAQCAGVDLLQYPQHAGSKALFYKIPIQMLVTSKPPRVIDVGMMLNTFRGWDSAKLGAHELELPGNVLRWMQQNFRYVFLTVSPEQEQGLRESGWFTFDVGRGEDDSRMVCAFPCEGPGGPGGTGGLWTWQ